MIDNLQFYMSDSGTGYVTGETINFSGATSGYDGTGTFSVPTNSEETSGGTMRALATSDPGSANIGISESLTGSLTAEGYSDYIVVQAKIDASTASGATQTKSFVLSYDEI